MHFQLSKIKVHLFELHWKNSFLMIKTGFLVETADFFSDSNALFSPQKLCFAGCFALDNQFLWVNWYWYLAFLMLVYPPSKWQKLVFWLNLPRPNSSWTEQKPDVVENYEPERYRLHGMPGTPKTRFEVVSRFSELEHSKMKMGFGNAWNSAFPIKTNLKSWAPHVKFWKFSEKWRKMGFHNNSMLKMSFCAFFS